MDVDNIQKIKTWIFEHACKYSMHGVLKVLVNDDNMYKKLSRIQGDGDHPAIADPHAMFVNIIGSFMSSLDGEKDHSDIDFPWNKDVHTLVMELLTTTFQQEHYISTRQLVHLITRLKLIALLKLCKEGHPVSDIMRNLNEYFPRWTQQLKTSIQAQYKIKDKQVLEKLAKTYAESRKFILRLLVSDACRRDYMSKNFEADMQKFANQAVSCLNQVLSVARDRIGPSMIEKIVNGDSSDDPSYADDPAVQMVLEYVQSCVLESNIMQLLQAIDGGTDFHLSDGMSSFLGEDDNISDTRSLSDAGSEMDEGDDDPAGDEGHGRGISDNIAGSTQPFDMSLDQSGILAGATQHFIPDEEIIDESEEERDVNEKGDGEDDQDEEVLSAEDDAKYPPIHQHLMSNAKLCTVKLFSDKTLAVDKSMHVIYN